MKSIYFCALLLSQVVAFDVYAQGDTLRQTCYQAMRYNVSVQMAANAHSLQQREHYRGEAFDSGNWQGIEKSETERMIAMASGSSGSMDFSYQYQTDSSFKDGYSSGFINDCLKNPSKYISR